LNFVESTSTRRVATARRAVAATATGEEDANHDI
jgi:hypothetical protein